MSAHFLEQFCVPSSRYVRRDSLQVVRTQHSFAILVCSWASSVWVALRVSAACVDLLSNHHDASSESQMSHLAYVGCVALL